MVDMVLIETSIIVDLLRKYQPALNWYSTFDLQLGVTKYVWLEIMQGCDNKQEQARAIKIMKEFQLVQLDLQDVDWALEQITQLSLANNRIDSMDALIAATSHRLQIPLYTRNIRHMQKLLGVLAVQPY